MAVLEEVENMRELVTSSSVEYALLLVEVVSKETGEVIDTLWVEEVVPELVVELIEVVEELNGSLWVEEVESLLVGIVDNKEEVVVRSEVEVEAIDTLSVEDVVTELLVKLEVVEELITSLWLEAVSYTHLAESIFFHRRSNSTYF